MAANTIYMKKLNFITALSITAGLAFAWNATADGIYYNTVGSHSEAAWLHTNNGIQNATFFQAVATESSDSILSFEIERNNTDNGFIFGTYTTTTEIDENGNEKTVIHKDTVGTVTDKTGTLGADGVRRFEIEISKTNDDGMVESVKDSAANSDPFKANEIVGVWMQEINSIDPVTKEPTYKDTIYYSDNKLTLEKNGFPDSDIYTVGVLGNGQGSPYGVGPDAYLWFDDDTIDVDNPGSGYSGQDTTALVKIHLQGITYVSGGNASGGPLPGVWATIALAGAAGTYLRRRKNK